MLGLTGGGGGVVGSIDRGGGDVRPEEAEYTHVVGCPRHEETHGEVDSPEGGEKCVLGVTVLKHKQVTKESSFSFHWRAWLTYQHSRVAEP